MLELWLQAADDPTLGLPASLLWEGDDDVFALPARERPARAILTGRLAAIEPLLAEVGIAFDDDEPTETELDDDAVRAFLRDAMPRLEEHRRPRPAPGRWIRLAAASRVNLAATRRGRGRGERPPLARDTLATFDWRLAVGDVVLTEEELAELAAAKEPLIRIAGRWHALRRADVERALRFLERRRAGAGVVDLVRAVSGLETDEAGVELGEVTLDAALAELLAGGDERRFRPLPTPAAMRHALFPFQERGHGWLRLLGDLGVGAILADDMGLGKTVQAIAMLVRARGGRRRGARPDARRLPDERHPAVGDGDRAVRARAARAPPPRRRPARREPARAGRRRPTSSSPRTTSRPATSRRSPRSPGTGCCSTRRRT